MRTPKPLRVALATNRFAPSVGGIETHVGRLAAALTAQGHQVTVLTHDLDGDAPDLELVDGVEVRRFLPLVPTQHYLASPALARHLDRGRDLYDVVHAHGYHDTPAAVASRWWTGPFVFTPHFHGTSASPLRAALHVPYRAIGRRVLDRADAVVCVSDAERRLLVRAFPRCHRRVEVVPNGVDVERLRTAMATPGPDRRHGVLVAGRLEGYKNVDRAASAVGVLAPTHRLEVCGDGPHRRALEAQVDQLGLRDAVTFHGTVDDASLAGLFAACHCLVSLSDHEAQGIVVREAAAVGLPVVASAIPAHVDAATELGASIALVPAGAGVRVVARAIAAATVGGRLAPAAVPTWDEVAARLVTTYRAAEAGADRPRAAA